MTTAVNTAKSPSIPDPEEAAYQDYFSFGETFQWDFPDGVQYLTFSAMNEGVRSEYQAATSNDVTLERQSGDARVRINPGTEREILVLRSITGWKIYRDGKPYEFSQQNLKAWYVRANPKLIDSLVVAIREANPWLLTDSMTVESVEEEITKLEETKRRLIREQAGKGASS